MRVAITGSSGFVGTALHGSLIADGHEVIRLVRRPATQAGEVSWDPAHAKLDPGDLEGVDAVVNLAGAPIGDRRWTQAYKKAILSSRTNATRTLTEALARLERRPRVLVSGSAIGYYGDSRGTDMLDEEDPAGSEFMARVVEQWESAAAPAAQAGIAVCHPRLGLVMGRKGGVFARMLPLFRLGLGGPLGSGDQYWSPVSLVDTIRALRFLLDTHGCTGPYNVTSPEPVTNGEFARVLAHALSRPALLPVPAVALQIRFGELAEHILASYRVIPRRLLEAGFDFDHPGARAIVAAALR